MFAYISGLKKNERLLEIISLVLVIVLVLITPLVYSIVPDKVLILTNDAGALESYNSKSALWLFPLIGVIIYAAISIQKYYLIKYREAPAKGEDPEHTTTVWILRMVKMIAMAGLIISVLEILAAASTPGGARATACFAIELVLVAGVFTMAFREVIGKYGKKG